MLPTIILIIAFVTKKPSPSSNENGSSGQDTSHETLNDDESPKLVVEGNGDITIIIGEDEESEGQ